MYSYLSAIILVDSIIVPKSRFVNYRLFLEKMQKFRSLYLLNSSIYKVAINQRPKEIISKTIKRQSKTESSLDD